MRTTYVFLIVIFTFIESISASPRDTRTDTLSKWLKFGSWDAQFRTMHISTFEKAPLPDFSGTASSLVFGYQSPKVKRFQVHLSIAGVFEWQSKLTSSDSMYASRYEVGLFTVENIPYRRELFRLENSYLSYSLRKGSFIKLGRFLLNIPFINPQDGRMRPNFQSGIWVGWKSKSEATHIEGGWLYGTSPRSTIHWYRMDESIGIYSQGRAINGQKATYFGNVSSAGMGILGLKQRFSEKQSVQAWVYWLENVFHMEWLEWKYQSKNGFQAALQGMYQGGIAKGLSMDTVDWYMEPNHKSMALSSRVGYKWKTHFLHMNYTRITSQGRFLFPREWGIEPFYTFLPRERSDGVGDSHAWMLQYVHGNPQISEKSIGIAYVHLPDVKNFMLNKYGMPSYVQANFRWRYTFSGQWKGLGLDLLYMAKRLVGNSYENPKAYEHNKVNLHQINARVSLNF